MSKTRILQQYQWSYWRPILHVFTVQLHAESCFLTAQKNKGKYFSPLRVIRTLLRSLYIMHWTTLQLLPPPLQVLGFDSFTTTIYWSLTNKFWSIQGQLFLWLSETFAGFGDSWPWNFKEGGGNRVAIWKALTNKVLQSATMTPKIALGSCCDE